MQSLLLIVTGVALIQGIVAVNKCCPGNQEIVGYGICKDADPKTINETYWWFPEEVLYSENKRFPDESPEGVRIGYVPCMPHQWHLVTFAKDFAIQDNGNLVYYDDRSSNTSWTFPEESYCVDRFALKVQNITKFTHVFQLCASRMVGTQLSCCRPGYYTKPNGNCGKIPKDAPFPTSIEISMDYFSYVSAPGCRDHDRSFLIDLNTSHHRFAPNHLEIYAIKYKSHSYCLSKNPYDGHVLAHFCTSVSEKFNFYPYFIFTGVLFFALTLIFHALLPELRNTNHAKYLIGHIVSLLVGFICIGIGQIRAEKQGTLCYIQAFVIQYSFLAAFFWLNVMCLDIAWTFSGFRPNTVGSIIERNRRKFIRYSIYAWGVPAIISVITAIFQFEPSQKESLFFPGFGFSSCFFKDKSPAIWLFFYGPTTFLMFLNIVLFIFTSCRIIAMRRDTQSVLQNQQSGKHKPTGNDKQTFAIYSKLFFLMGISWATEMLSSLIGGPRYYYYFTDILNLLRSVFIFIFFCCKRQVFVLLADRYGDKIPALKRFFPNERKMSASKSGVTNSSVVTMPQKNHGDMEMT